MWESIKVVELASVLAGPAVGMFFAELGAQVIKIENQTTGGDMTRKWKLKSEDPDNTISAYFSSINYRKSYLSLDIKDQEDRKKIDDLLAGADIVIANFKPESAKRFQLDFASVRRLNPQIIYGEINGFSGNSDRAAFDVVLQAETGWMSMNGTPESGPVKMPVALIDVLAAHQLKEGILTAMLEQRHTNKAMHVKVSLYDAALSSLVNQASNYLMEKHIPQRMGSAHPNIAPYGDLFTTKDGATIVLAVGTNKHFELLCQHLKLNLLPEFTTNPQRVKHREQLIAYLSEPIGKQDSTSLLAQLIALGIPAGKVKDLKEVFEDEQAQKLIREEKIEATTTRRLASKVFTMYS